MFTRRFTLFKLFGFEVKLDLSWLVLGFLVAWSLAQGMFPSIVPGLARETYWLMGVAGAFGLLFSIIFHELSHALVARRRGLRMHGITLFIFGGVAEMADEPRDAKTEFLMAVGGPIASFVLAFVFYQLYLFVGRDTPTAVSGVLYYFAFVNLLLGAFNLVPGFPLDGGRMLRAALWGWKKDLRWATRVSAAIGGGFGMALILLGVFVFVQGNFVTGMWYFLIGMFLRNAAGMSYQQLLVRDAIKGESVRRFMNPQIVTVDPGITVARLVSDFVYQSHHKAYPVVQYDRLMGIVSTDQIKTVPPPEWDRRTVHEIMLPSTSDNTIGPDTDVLNAWNRMSRTGKSRLMVVENKKLLGMLALSDLMKFLALKFDLERASG
ncbi:MAG: peptidase M50 [Candidatus Muproteobacteria bacterium RBG_16_60_9]|uniref:Zinc metalloprotease n=1 Tax=Candidatus Muproteobacteria bacterium RBG_16_60_9 TaxID=1817755 RepID=A0A1F6V395_9PROT|nr:MAG: peptidase M50 [Candidatus Muproteobacteria bacterium RBG_16_60_9]